MRIWVADRQDSPNGKSNKYYLHDRVSVDSILLSNFAKKDREIVIDAIVANCDALLTNDGFGGDQGNKFYIFKKYKMMILSPSEIWKIWGPFINLIS